MKAFVCRKADLGFASVQEGRGESMKRRFNVRGLLRRLIPCVFAAVFLAAPGFRASAETEKTHVVILATSDLHADILGYSYEDGAETANTGMARLYTYIEQVRKENPVVFLVDAGDAIQGTIMSDDIANKQPDEVHPVMAAMNRMGYDVITIGNHEFDCGVPAMEKILSQADFPVLAANVLNPDGSCITGAGWTIAERGGVKLAVIGVCTPAVPVWDGGKEGVGSLNFEAASTAVGKALREIGDRADLVLVSAHMGQYAEFDEDGGSDAGEKIAEDNPEIDFLQLAHMHITVNTEIGGKPAVAVRNSGREIARIDVTLDGERKIMDVSTSIVDMADYEPSAEIREIPAVKTLHEQTLAYVRGGAGGDGEPGEPLGETTAAFQPENEIRGLPEGRLRDTAVMDLILNIQLLNSGADVTASALFKDASDLPAGTVCYVNIFDIYKYDNTLYTVEVTGRELKAYMEWAAECYNQWQPGDINISFDPEYPGYLHDQFAGVEYEINLSRPKGERIENVLFRGEPLQDGQTLKLAVNNFRYSAALRPYNLVAGKRNWESSGSVRDMIVAYFAEHSPVSPSVDNNWRITGVNLSEDDPRRAEIIGYINDGLLPVPYNQSYNLADYDALVAEARANAAGEKSAEE